MARRPAIDRIGFLGSLVTVLIVVIDFSVGPGPPDIKDSASKVASFYGKHQAGQMTASFVLAIAAGFMLIFVVHLWRALRLAEGPGSAWSSLALAGGVIAVAGVFLMATIHVALADAAKHGYSPDQLRTLNALDNDGFIPLAGGFALLAIGTGISLARGRLLPSWLGWIGIVLGIAGFTPAGFFALLLILLWLVVLGVMLYLRPPALAKPAGPPTAAAPG
jgi:hypothetical protein